MLSALAVRLLQQRVVKTGAHHRRLEVVRDDALRRPAQGLQRVRWHSSQVAIFWSKTNSTYWWRLQDRTITKAHARRNCPVAGSAAARRNRSPLGLPRRAALDPHRDCRLRCRFQRYAQSGGRPSNCHGSRAPAGAARWRSSRRLLAQLLHQRPVRFHRRGVLRRFRFGSVASTNCCNSASAGSGAAVSKPCAAASSGSASRCAHRADLKSGTRESLAAWARILHKLTTATDTGRRSRRQRLLCPRSVVVVPRAQ